MHEGEPYDPVKAHEYYIRTRKLKGRKKGAQPQRSGRGRSSASVDLIKTRASAAARVAGLRKKIHLLKRELNKREAEAKKAAKEAKKPDSAAEKRKKAKESAQYRDKHKQQLKTKAKTTSKSGGSASSKSKSGGKKSTEELKSTIDRLETKLAAAVARQKALG